MSHIKFVFAGAGPLENLLNDLPNVENVGFQTGKQLDLLIEKARFSVCPSEWYDNCPFSVMESQERGTPVIGSDIGGIPELIQAGVDGELFESQNVKALMDALNKLWTDDGLIEKYERNCRKIRRDDVGEYADKILEVCRSLG